MHPNLKNTLKILTLFLLTLTLFICLAIWVNLDIVHHSDTLLTGLKTAYTIIGFLLLGLTLFIGYIIWVNVSSGQSREELLAALPNKITPKYDLQKSRNWWKETTVYQIYPRSFKDSNGDGIGDIQGIINQLDYIKSLGFETIWISPFFKSPQTDHGYDISDYLDIQPEYGDLATVDRLIEEVHQREMKIVFDLVLNHTSIEHEWFKESKKSKDNPKSDWYVWRDGKNDAPPNNWKNILGQVSGWNYEAARDQYYYAAFLPFQPDLNMSNPEVKAEIFNIIRFWLNKGVDGFRLDIFSFIFEEESYSDNPTTWRIVPNMGQGKWLFEEHKYNFHQPEVIDFAKEFRAILESYPDGRFMVGEVFGSHLHMRELLGTKQLDGLNLVFLFDFLEKFKFSADYFRQKVIEYEAFYPAPLVPTYVFGNHDQFRIMSRLGNDERKAEVLAAFQLTMRGVPFVYQGEEIGMTTADIPLQKARDPLSKYWAKFPKWIRQNVPFLFNRDNCRTPMQWSNEVVAGFSSNSNTWLPIQENYKQVNVENKLTDSNSIIHTYKDILALRQACTALKTGQITLFEPNTLPKNVLAYSRHKENERLSIYLNFSKKVQKIHAFAHPNPTVKYQKRASLKGQNINLEGFGILIILEAGKL